jgi:thymidine phosphorylase
MDQPLARSAGNALEVMEAVAILRGDERPERLLEVVLALTAELLHLGGLAQNRDLARQMALQALESGRAAERFARMVASQGGPADLLERPASHFPETDFVRAVPPPEAGFLQSIDTRKIGNLVVALGGGRHRVEDRIDTRVGLSDIRFVGEAVDGQQPLAVVHATCEEAWAKAAAVLQSAVRVASRPVEPNPAVLRRIEGRKGHD